MNRFLESRLTAAIATLTLMGVVLVGGPTNAGAATLSWSETPSPFDYFNAAYPPGGAGFHEYPTGSLSSVSCASARFCMALGTPGPNDDLIAAPTVIEMWDGARWLVAPRSRVVGGSFSAISCATTTFCV